MHTPLTAATTGLVDSSVKRIRLSRLGSAVDFGEPNSRMSAPPEKALPAPVSTMACTAASACALFTPSAIARRVSKLRPLTGGLFSAMTATPSRTS